MKNFYRGIPKEISISDINNNNCEFNLFKREFN